MPLHAPDFDLGSLDERQLRAALRFRHLDADGAKPALVARLAAWRSALWSHRDPQEQCALLTALTDELLGKCFSFLSPAQLGRLERACVHLRCSLLLLVLLLPAVVAFIFFAVVTVGGVSAGDVVVAAIIAAAAAAAAAASFTPCEVVL